MHRRCCFFCQATSAKVPGLTLHNFPNDLTLRKIWLEGCGYAHEKFFPHSKLCSLHFDESSYKITKSRRLLKDNAIPTKFEKNSNFDFGVKPNKLLVVNDEEITNHIVSAKKPVECEKSSSEMKNDVSTQIVECEKSDSEMKMNVSTQIECEKSGSEMKIQKLSNTELIQNILELPKSKMSHRLDGDIATPVLSTPKRTKKKNYAVIKLKILKQRRKIRTLQQRVNRLKKKNSSLSSLYYHLKKTKFDQ
ncbi:THAP domain-containing protein 2-like isoform X2 [Myzus persicae]|uniref:THAP domain-containing protein 2-like isoform X2 n=1 Tax=Myzus persicae TaxID=13164 RepID=UPI000B931918|nr:THAP domain-containing protein 2-like isoform X2 [Myzus persicae]